MKLSTFLLKLRSYRGEFRNVNGLIRSGTKDQHCPITRMASEYGFLGESGAAYAACQFLGGIDGKIRASTIPSWHVACYAPEIMSASDSPVLPGMKRRLRRVLLRVLGLPELFVP